MINRFNYEIKFIELLDDDLKCKIYKIDYKNNIIVMEKIIPGNPAKFYSNKELYKKMFENLYMFQKKIDKHTYDSFRDFKAVVKDDFETFEKKCHKSRFISKLFKTMNDVYDSQIGIDNYLLHGDIYMNNALICNDDKIKLIDPLGFKGNFVIELEPICAYEMFYNELHKDYKNILEDFCDFFSEYVNKEKYKSGLFCELVKVFIPSLFEANDGYIRAQKWLDILTELFPQYTGCKKYKIEEIMEEEK